MNIYITCTPEFSTDKLVEVISLLKAIPGELKFFQGKPLTPAQFKRLDKKFDDISQIDSLTFDEYFDMVQGYRELREIRDEDFVIVISSIRHNRNWFSAFNKRNIFVRGDEWDIISNVDSKFGIAYQCVENIFQSLIDLDIFNYKSEPNIHMEACGCINDFCGYKPDILKKLRMADICDSCYERSLSKGVNDFIITQILDILEEIRKEFVISSRFRRRAKFEKVSVDSKGNIYISDKKIDLNTLPKVVYICLLNNLEGIPSDKVCKNKNLFEKIYLKIKKNPEEFAIQRLCCKTITYQTTEEKNKPTFAIYKRRINEELIKKLGVTLANYYSVNLVEDLNHQILYKVNLPKEQLELDDKFKE